MKFTLLIAFIVAITGCRQEASSPKTSAVPSACEISNPAKSGSLWEFSESENVMDGKKKTTAMLSNSVGSSIVIRCTGARLMDDLLCKKGKLEAYVTTREMVGGEAVRLKFDDGVPVRQNWSRSDDYKGLFSPNPRQFVADLVKSKKFYFEYSPYEKIPDTVLFTSEGIQAATQGFSMQSFLDGLTKDEVLKICGPGVEESPNEVRAYVSYPPSNPVNLGLRFEFSTYGNDTGKLLNVKALGDDAKAEGIQWFRDTGGVGGGEREALTVIGSSPGLFNQWKARQPNPPAKAKNPAAAGQ